MHAWLRLLLLFMLFLLLIFVISSLSSFDYRYVLPLLLIWIVSDLAPIQYDVVFVTGDLKGAGTSAKVFLTIFGQNGDTGKRSVNQTWRSFGKNQKDQFRLEALDLGMNISTLF